LTPNQSENLPVCGYRVVVFNRWLKITFFFNSNRDHTFSVLNWKNLPKSDVIWPPETSRTSQNCDIKELGVGPPIILRSVGLVIFFQFRCSETILFEIRLMFHPIFYKKKKLTFSFWNGGNRIFGYPNQIWNLHNSFITPSVFETVEIVFLDILTRCYRISLQMLSSA